MHVRFGRAESRSKAISPKLLVKIKPRDETGEEAIDISKKIADLAFSALKSFAKVSWYVYHQL